MKKQFARYFAGFILSIAMFSYTHAQNNHSSPAPSSPEPADLAINTKIKGGNMPAADGLINANINAKALKNFSKTFKQAATANWFVIKDGFLAKFQQDGIITKVFYNPKGRWVGNLRCYFEDKLPRDIRHLVRSNYYDYSIYYVNEVTVPGDITVYLVKIEDKTSLKTIRVQDGEMDEIEAFTKSK